MKRLIISCLIALGMASVGYATGSDVNRSSFTATGDTLKVLGLERTTLSAVVVSTPSTVGATLKLYDSNGVASGLIADIDLRTIQSPEFEVRCSSGLTYTSTASNGVTIIFR